MKGYKRLKDPVYGYVNVRADYMEDIVDTAPFQRLRRIIQTSYSPLYSSAVHNRFVHSIGVYHLGEIVSDTLKKEIPKKFKLDIDLDGIERSFLLACLLHDAGHAPFSHTGEKFYLYPEGNYEELHSTLIQCVDTETFTKDVPAGASDTAAPHELMSAIVGLKEYAHFLKTPEEKELFARCITGYQYKAADDSSSLKNCFISMLNSKVIDVDKLDYLIRDAFITGFDTVNIDFERLLTSLTIVERDGTYELAYNKNAVSVIENVVYAHDAERKWIQNHPVVLYETYILQHIFKQLGKYMDADGQRLFSLESLGREGHHLKEGSYIRLMCDDDIICLMKNKYYDGLSDEYFERNKRRHPIWKSEPEYKAFVIQLTGGDLFRAFEHAMIATANYLRTSTDNWVIDDTLVKAIEKELDELDESGIEERSIRVQRKNKKGILKVAECLQTYSQDMGNECSFVILMTSQFYSGFSKPDFSKTNIVFPMKNGERVASCGEIVTSLRAKEREGENFFYLFYKRKNIEDADIDKNEICKRLFQEFLYDLE